ncbi:MAG TPA: C-terminal helicase domain-containing protein, partial [Candidatus Eisenbacteria bacterium]|nr:C-terminal helicase domain-containing protein [Candidatus Eisenbacteria bacterium]
ETVEIGARRTPAETVKHVIYPVAERQKLDLTLALLDEVHYDSVIVFCRTKDRADHVARLLKKNNHAVAVLHSNRTQREREEALKGFRDGHFEVLVATDIASRGIDVEGISHVVNYDVPHSPEDYVHRIGRTGRVDAVGDAFTLMSPEEQKDFTAIERFLGRAVPRVMLPDFDYHMRPREIADSIRGDSGGRGGKKRGGRSHGASAGSSGGQGRGQKGSGQRGSGGQGQRGSGGQGQRGSGGQGHGREQRPSAGSAENPQFGRKPKVIRGFDRRRGRP